MTHYSTTNVLPLFSGFLFCVVIVVDLELDNPELIDLSSEGVLFNTISRKRFV